MAVVASAGSRAAGAAPANLVGEYVWFSGCVHHVAARHSVALVPLAGMIQSWPDGSHVVAVKCVHTKSAHLLQLVAKESRTVT